MYIQVVLSTLYTGHVYHAYLNALSNGKKYGWPIITNEEYVESPLKYEEVYLNEYDMDVLTEKECNKIAILGIASEFYIEREKHYGSRTNSLTDLFIRRNLEFESYVENFIAEIKEIKENLFKGFMVFGESYESIKFIANKYGVEIINYEFSTFRKSNGFLNNLMYGTTKGQLYSSDEGRDRYYKFKEECQEIELFSRRELIALVGKLSTLHLLPLLDGKAKYEIGICSMGASVLPQGFCREQYTDEDLLYKCNKVYKPEEIVVRAHPAYLSDELSDFALLHRDPIDFVLSCRRIAAVSSNVLIEAMMWNRVACTECNVISFSFACENDLKSKKVVDEEFLNFFIIGYLIPGQKYLFNPEYWKWRRSCKNEKEIFIKHLNYILAEIGLDSSIMKLGEKERFIRILQARGLSLLEIENLNKNVEENSVDYNALSSYIDCIAEDATNNKRIYCLNSISNDEIISEFKFENNQYKEILFSPFGDIVGMIKVKEILVNGNKVQGGDNEFQLTERTWTRRISAELKDGLNSIYILWQYKSINFKNIRNEFSYIKTSMEKADLEKEKILNSMTWRITKPFRVMCDVILNRKKGGD